MRATITAVAHYVPPETYDNSWFTKFMDTNDEWIRTRTGIVERHFMNSGNTSDLIVPAVHQILNERGLTAEDIDCIIVATITPDNMFPSCAATVQMKLGAKRAWGYDLSAACSGFLYGLWSGAKIIEGGAKRVLVCGADKMSSILNYNDRTTAVLFGDGAGVALLEQGDDDEIGIMDSILCMDGNGGKNLYQEIGIPGRAAEFEGRETKDRYVVQDGQSVFKSAVVGMAEVSAQIMEKNNMTADDIAWLVPHQANLRIIDATANRMGIGKDKVMVNIDRYGNTTAGTIPICLSELHHLGKLKKGDNLILSSFGAGYTWGSIWVRWGLDTKQQ